MRRWLRALAIVTMSCSSCGPSESGDAITVAPEMPSEDASRASAAIDVKAPEQTAMMDAGADAHALVPDAAMETSAPVGDAGFFGASRCSGGSFFVCEDFETPALDTNRWFYNPGNGGNASGFAALDKSRAARGKQSLHFHTETNPKGSGSQVKAKSPEPRLANGFFLRSFVYFGQPIPDHHLNYFNVVAPGNDGGMFTVGSLDGKLGIVEFGPHNGDHAVTADPLVIGRWVCLEWQVHPSTNEVRVWLDESEVSALHVTDWLPSAFSDFFLELISYQGTYDIWIDELAYGPERIGCRG
jgi:hypothetical protein